MNCSALKVALNNGVEMPMIGFGTFTIKGQSIITKVLDAALACGYRFIDTAAVYRNEEEIAIALKELLPKYGLLRSDLFLTSKLAPADHGKDRVRQAVLDSLSRLNTPYLDLYLVHWPGAGRLPSQSPANRNIRIDTWRELEKLQNEGKLRSIGVSNYLESHLKELLSATTVKPAVNQVELHPHFPQKDLVKFCNQEGILVQAYSSLGGHSSHILLADPQVKQVAKVEGKSVSQVLLKWAVQQGIGVIPKSIHPERIKENFCLDFTLSSESMRALSSLKIDQKYAWDPRSVV
ncbi:glyoxal reductase-like isoform X4 [Neocloeon triangulifer]|nr:glyoxal reductase-like isoform X4 [Neocloeon triangulifer]